jgi:signal transduction histidine kinase
MQGTITIIQNLSFTNLDLLTVGGTIAAIALLGFVVYIRNTKSITGIGFLLFCAVTMLWSFFNYISYQTNEPMLTVWYLRIVLFLGLWHAFTFFNFFYIFPEDTKQFPSWYTRVLLPYVILLSCFILSKGVVSGYSINGITGKAEPIIASGISIFFLTALSLLIASFVIFIKKFLFKQKGERGAYGLILIGAGITFAGLITCNLVLPAVLEITRFIPLGAVTLFPFCVFTAYAIFKHKAFKVNNIVAPIFAFFLCMATFVEIIFAENYGAFLLRVGIFMFVLLISIQFIKNIFKLEEANEQKSEFISFASHEIRTPITVMRGYASLMVDQDDASISPEMKQLAKKILISGNDVIALISQYLNKSKMELGQIKYSMTVFDMTQLVIETVSGFILHAEERKLTLISEIDTSFTYKVKGDQGKLKEVIGNLIDNSLKYTPNGSVTISLYKEKGDIIVKIQDTGVGISKETLPFLFKEFSRADTKKVNILGTGLGLYLAKTFVEAQKGKVWAESEGEGKGSQFYITLPEVVV